MQLRLAGEAQAELAGVGPAEDHHAGAFQPLDELAVFRRHDVFEELAAPRRRAAGEGGAEVLQQIGHAGERPLGEAAGDGLAAMVVELVGDRVDGTVARVDPFDRSLQQFLRSSFAPCNQRGQSDRIMLFIVRKGGHLVSPFGAASRTPGGPGRPPRPTLGACQGAIRLRTSPGPDPAAPGLKPTPCGCRNLASEGSDRRGGLSCRIDVACRGWFPQGATEGGQDDRGPKGVDFFARVLDTLHRKK